MPDCHICCEESNLLLINRIHTCTTCINKLIRPVVNGSAMYPVIINNEPADLKAHEKHLSRTLFQQYAQMEEIESIPPHLRVHCANQHFAGKRVEASADGTYLAEISLCDECKCATCLICRKDLDMNATTLARIADHGCKAELDAEEKTREEAFEGLERGKDYQFCPTYKRDVQLAEACHHIACPCKTHFCYECGEVLEDGHYKLGKCTHYPVPPSAPAPAVEPLQLHGEVARDRTDRLWALYDTFLRVGEERMERELVAILQDIGPHRFFLVNADGAVADAPADLAGQVLGPQDQGVDLWLAILSERIRWVEAELSMNGAWATRTWARLPPHIRVEGQARHDAVARNDVLRNESLHNHLRTLIGDIQTILSDEADAARRGNQAPRTFQQRLHYRFQPGTERRGVVNFANNTQAQVDHLAALLPGLNVEEVPIEPVVVQEAAVHREEAQLHGPGGYAARRAYWRRRDQVARHRRGRGGRGDRADDYANEG